MLHNDVPGVREIEVLASVQGRTCVTIVTPTEDKPQHPDAPLTTFRNQAKAVLERITDETQRRVFADRFVEFTDPGFWRHQCRSLVLYATTDTVVTYRLANRLGAVEVVADRLHLKPLLRATTFPQSAFVLALAENSVRLIELSGDAPARERDVPDLPTSAADHAGRAAITGRSEFGGLSGSDQRQLRVRQYARAIDRALRAVLPDGTVPLILAAAEPIASIYREVNTYPELLAATLAGSPETRSAGQLGTDARPLLDRFYADRIAEWHRVFAERRQQGRALTDLADAARAATYGQIATMLIDMDTVVAGTLDPQTGAVSLQAGEPGYGLVDEIARRALLSGARVLAVRRADIPEGAELAAILRFAPVSGS